MAKETIFYGGTIITMDEKQPHVEAVYVKDGKIAAVGTYEEIGAYKHEGVELVDLKGATMMPGLIEPHGHFELSSMLSQAHYIGGLKYGTAEEVIAEIKKAVAATPKGKWVFCFGLDFLINRDLPEIDRHWLDAITSEHPLFLMLQSMHTIYANSMALERVGINRDTQDTRDGHCYKDENGEPTGVLTEQSFSLPFAMKWLMDLGKNPNQLLMDEAMYCKSKGITATWIAGVSPLFPNHFDLMYNFINSEKCPLRCDYDITFNTIENGMVKLEDVLKANTDKYRMTGIKSWYDGSPYTGNMYMDNNYLENETMQKKLLIPVNQAGESLFPLDVFYNILRKYHDMGYQLSIHTQGDRSCREVIDTLEKVLKDSPRKDHRHRLEHCAFILPEDLKRCGDLGITVSFHTNHLYYYGEALNELVIGEKRTRKMLPCKTALDNGVKISFHADSPMYKADPLRVASNAVTRTSKNGTVIGAQEAITVDQAMRGITIDAAWQLFRENEIGSIEVGKFADFAVLEENPYQVAPTHIGDIKVITTYLNGVNTDNL